MPLQNRVTAFGEIVADSARGQMMGNRGGRLHTRDKILSQRRWASRAWIFCVLDFKNRHRSVMSPNSYTELFFLDEVTALATGHRPCFECQRRAANEFAGLWGRLRGENKRARADGMDRQLHSERLANMAHRAYPKQDISSLPDGAMVLWQGKPAAVRGSHLLPWSLRGYETALTRPQNIEVEVMTPLSTVDILRAGYVPRFHVPSA